MKQTQTRNLILQQDWREAGGAIVPAPPAPAKHPYDYHMPRQIDKHAHQRAQLTRELQQGTYDPYIANLGTIEGLKLMRSVNGRLFSTYTPMYGPTMEYRLGKEYTEEVRHDHGGGLYLYLTTSVPHFMSAFDQGVIISPAPGNEFALVAVRATGPYIFYGYHGEMLRAHEGRIAKKAAASGLFIRRVVYTFEA